MSTEAMVMMAAVLTVVWGGFIASLIFAVRQEKKLSQEVEGDSK